MPDKFSYEEIATEVLKEYEQEDTFKERFVGFCQNAMEGKAEDNDLERLITNVKLSEEEIDEA
jgi:hypothetical protein